METPGLIALAVLILVGLFSWFAFNIYLTGRQLKVARSLLDENKRVGALLHDIFKMSLAPEYDWVRPHDQLLATTDDVSKAITSLCDSLNDSWQLREVRSELLNSLVRWRNSIEEPDRDARFHARSKFCESQLRIYDLLSKDLQRIASITRSA